MVAEARSFWKGHLRLSLVTIPVRLVNATVMKATRGCGSGLLPPQPPRSQIMLNSLAAQMQADLRHNFLQVFIDLVEERRG